MQIMEENAQGSVTPATRQLFDVAVQSDSGSIADRQALVIRDDGHAPKMALLQGRLDDHYQLQREEQLRPMTPRIDGQCKAASDARIPYSEEDRDIYAEFDQMRAAIPHDPRTHHIPTTANVHFDNVEDVSDSEMKAIVVPPGGIGKIGTGGVANCIVCAATAPSLKVPGGTVLALTHYTGATQQGILTPKQCLQELRNLTIAEGGDPSRIEFRLAGGERATSANEDAHRLDDEFEFLELRSEFPIVAAHIQTTNVDTNSDNTTIFRFTNDDHGSSINAVLTTDGFFYSHARLYGG
jgi:hypothetical protein